MRKHTYNKYLLGFIICVICAVICLVALLVRFGSYFGDSDVTGTVDGGGETVFTLPTKPDNTVRVTFPEGFNAMQMADRLEENGVCTADDFLTTMNTVDYTADYSFLPPMEKLSQRIYYLEGYLFPDTYDFYKNESADSVIRRFLNNFANQISDDYYTMAAHTGEFYNIDLTFDDVIIMASIVEKEISANPSEMPGVAAAFYNRMKYPGGTVDGSATGGYFQSDATKFYPYIYGATPEGFVSDYNTFNVKGFPKGPICCPSIDAIRASLNPDTEQKGFFFYTDINKKVYFAVTFNEHQANYKYCIDNGLAP